MGSHVFVCYASKDIDFVLRFAAALKAQGVPIWLDQWDIPHGANWNRTRDNALYDAAHCIVALSHAAVESEQVEAEWVTALEEQKHVVPILYQTCRIPSRLRLLQRFDFTNSRIEDEAILTVLVRVLGGQLQSADSSLAFQPPGETDLAGESKTRPETNPKITSSPSTFSNSIGMEFILILSGEFRMGAEDGATDEKPVHRVRLTRPFYLAKYPTTQAQ
jgi:formylglycine-generating enzyme required for sulfatase activity